MHDGLRSPAIVANRALFGIEVNKHPRLPFLSFWTERLSALSAPTRALCDRHYSTVKLMMDTIR
jgi:hypothetical protein